MKAKEKVPCMGCDKQIPVGKTLCGGCAEDMGYARRAR